MLAQRVLPAVLVVATLIATGCGADGSSGGEQPAASSAVNASAAATAASSRFPDRYRRGLERAFAKAESGQSPTNACAIVTGSVAGQSLEAGTTPDPDRVATFEFCFVDASLLYMHRLMEEAANDASPDRNESLCRIVTSHLVVSRSSIGTFAKNLNLELTDLSRRIADGLDPRLVEQCPMITDVFVHS